MRKSIIIPIIAFTVSITNICRLAKADFTPGPTDPYTYTSLAVSAAVGADNATPSESYSSYAYSPTAQSASLNSESTGNTKLIIDNESGAYLVSNDGAGGEAISSPNFGILHAYAAASARVTPGYYAANYNGASITAGTTDQAAASGYAIAQYGDFITIHSNTLAAGTPVLLSIGLHVDGSTSLLGGGEYNDGIYGDLTYGGSVDGGNIIMDTTGTAQDGFIGHYVTKEFQGQVGETISIVGQLTAGPMQLNANYAFPDVQGLADASNTSITTFEVLTPDAYYTSASGTQYLTSIPDVPEPTSCAILAFGVLPLLMRRRRD